MADDTDRHESPDDELELLARWQQGDNDAGAMLFDRYYKPVRRFFDSKTSDGVEDLVQDTFLAVQQGRERIRCTRFRNYLFGTAHNLLRAFLRRRHTAELDSGAKAIATLDPTVSALLAAESQQHVMQIALQRVPLDDQIVLELRFWEDLTGPEIAEVLQLPEGTVRSRLRRAMARLGEEIARVEASPALLEMTLRDFSRWREDLRAFIGSLEDERPDSPP